jgi:hypothetical protein
MAGSFEQEGSSSSLSRSDFILLSRDIATAIRQLCDQPDRAEEILVTLNHRLRPLGVRVEKTGSSVSHQPASR